MRIDPDVIEASRPDDREIALLAAEVRRLQAVINSEEPTLTDEEREAIKWAEHEAQAFAEMGGGPRGFKFAATLRALFERTQPNYAK
jgi:hypothetical protein